MPLLLHVGRHIADALTAMDEVIFRGVVVAVLATCLLTHRSLTPPSFTDDML